jgi:hypothetical protein
VLDLGPNGHEHGEAWRALGEARKLLSHRDFDAGAILALGRAALGHARVSHLLSSDPATDFLAARLHDAGQFADRLEELGPQSRLSLGTLLHAIEFILKAAHYQAGLLDQAQAGFIS